MYNPVFAELGWATYEYKKTFCLDDAKLSILEKSR